MTLQLLEQFRRRSRAEPEQVAVRQVECAGVAERTVTRGELAVRVDAIASRLVAGLPPGGVVLLSAPNQPEFTAAFLATLAAGLRAFPVSPELAERFTRRFGPSVSSRSPSTRIVYIPRSSTGRETACSSARSRSDSPTMSRAWSG